MCPLNWLSLLLCFLAGALLANAVPHLTNGMSGRSFQTPFSRPHRLGKSSPVVNVLWGSLNLGVGFVLFSAAGAGSVRATVLAAAGGLVMAVVNALEFGRSNSD
jgi:hypothetical protein